MKRHCLFFILLLNCVLLFSEDKFSITHGPYLCNPTETGVSVVWTTNRPALSWVEIAPDDDTHFYACQRSKYYSTKSGRKLATKTLHHVRLENLEPGTTYRYRVLSTEVTEWNNKANIQYGRTVDTDVYRGEPLRLKTLKRDFNEMTFLVLNDIHSKASFMRDLCRSVDFKSLDLIVLNGDMSSYIENEEMIFSGYMDSIVSMGASETPIVYTRGNHETRGVYADELINYFPSKIGEFYQYFKSGNVGFLILDCGEDKPDTDHAYRGLADYDAYRAEQASWLKEVNKTREFIEPKVRIVFCHMPLVGTAKKIWHGNGNLQQTLLPVLNDSKINLMFSGHNHEYSYHLPEPGKINFPTLVNDNETYVLCKVKDRRISVEVVGLKGVLYSFDIQ